MRARLLPSAKAERLNLTAHDPTEEAMPIAAPCGRIRFGSIFQAPVREGRVETLAHQPGIYRVKEGVNNRDAVQCRCPDRHKKRIIRTVRLASLVNAVDPSRPASSYARGTKRVQRTIRRAAVVLAAVVAVGSVSAPSVASVPVTAQVLSGTVLDGTVPVGNAEVTMTAWPVGSVLWKLPDNVRVPTLQLGRVTTGADGRFSFSPDLLSIGPKYTQLDGAVNVSVSVVAGRAAQEFALPLAAGGSQAAAHASVAVPGSRAAVVNFNMSGQQLAERLGSSTAHMMASHTEGIAAGMTPAERTAVISPDGLCTSNCPPSSPSCKHHNYLKCHRVCTGWNTGRRLPNRTEEFINIYATGPGHADAEEDFESSHTLGAAMEWAGADWGVSGSVEITKTTRDEAHKTIFHNRLIGNSVNYREFYRTCIAIKHGRNVFSKDHTAWPQGLHTYFPDKAVKPISEPAWNLKTNCDKVTHWSHTKTQGFNKVFSGGVHLGFINLSAHAEYSHETKVTFFNNTGKKVYICGSTPDGEAKAPQAGFKPIPPPECRPGGPCAPAARYGS